MNSENNKDGVGCPSTYKIHAFFLVFYDYTHEDQLLILIYLGTI